MVEDVPPSTNPCLPSLEGEISQAEEVEDKLEETKSINEDTSDSQTKNQQNKRQDSPQ